MTRKSKPPITIYSALADATRCRIVEILLAGPIPVHTLANAFSISRPAISRHLRVLKTAGLVAEVKKGRENLYALRPARLAPATAWINTIVVPAPAEAPGPAAAPAPTPMPAVSTEPATGEEMPEAMPAAASAVGRPSTGAEPIIVSEPTAQPILAVVKRKRAEKADQSDRVSRPEPAASQMGFDF
jgi:DNA-binding transcriptional ArsR family regulator